MGDYFIRVTAAGDEQTVRRKVEGLIDFGTIKDAFSDADIDFERIFLLPGPTVDDGVLGALWERAREHGEESEPQHEVGDLQELSRLCWQFLTEAERRLVAACFREQLHAAE